MPNSEVIIQRTPEEEAAIKQQAAHENVRDIVRNLTRVMTILASMKEEYKGSELGRLCAVANTDIQKARDVIYVEIYLIALNEMRPFEEARG